MPKPRRKVAKKRVPKAKAPPQSRRPANSMLAPADDLAPRIGRPAFKATDKDREFVRAMSAAGVSIEGIATVIGCERHTLAKHFRREIDDGRYESMAAVASSLFQKATAKVISGASVRAAEIWLRRFPEWLEAERPRNPDDDAGESEIVVTGGLPERDLREIPMDEDPGGAEGGA